MLHNNNNRDLYIHEQVWALVLQWLGAVHSFYGTQLWNHVHERYKLQPGLSDYNRDLACEFLV